MEKKFWNSEKILSFTALLVSLMTLIVFLYQTNLMRKEQHISVLPYLALSHNGTHTKNYIYALENNGVGPAILTNIKVVDAKGEKHYDVADYVEANLTQKDTIGYFHSNLRAGQLLPEKERIDIIELYYKKIKSANRLNDILTADSLQIEIEYESVYGKKWVIKNGQ